MQPALCVTRSSSSRLISAIFILAFCILTGCGTNPGSNMTTQKLTGTTSVTAVLSSTANDQLTQFDLQLQALSLTSQSGKTVSLLTAAQPSEYMHLNGGIDPLVSVTVPQDIYTAATVTIAYGNFVCIANGVIDGSPSLEITTYNDNVPASSVTVNLPSPITVTGTSMGLALNLLVSQSASVPDCLNPMGFTGYSLTPTFNVSPFTLASSPTNPENGKVAGLEGQVASISSGNNFTLSVPEGPSGTRTLFVTTGSATAFQGISGFSALAKGMFVNMDGALETSGSVAATRIAVDDPSAVNLLTGPLMQVASDVPVLLVYGRQEQGPLSPGPIGAGEYFTTPYLDFSNAVFGISGQFTNLQSLPFVASFNASNMVAGQNVDISASTLSVVGGVYTPANMITLIPQTINATVVGSSVAGNFTDYTVSLAPYDLFPALAVQPGQSTLLANPGQIEVYVDNHTQMLNSQPIASGSTLRFYGLVFNDNGTLRMDCSQVNDGVAAASQSNSTRHLLAGEQRIIGRNGPGGLRETIRFVSTR